MGIDGVTVVSLADVEALPWRGTELVWRPVRAALGTRIVGISAYSAMRPGQQVVEDHVEDADGRGHEEVYYVAEGSAEFLLAGERIVAPSGTFIRVSSDVRRSALALEPGTTVVALGGPAVFEPAVSEWIERARPWFAADPDRARWLIDDLREVYGDHPGVFFAEALFAAGRGDEDEGARWLAMAVARSKRAAEAARGEPTLAGLLAEP